MSSNHLRRVISNPDFTVDQYDNLAWLNLYGEHPKEFVIYDLQQMGMTCGVIVKKNKAELPTQIERWYGDIPNAFTVEEFGVKFEIHTSSAHPGLFLDHQLTRKWLFENAADTTVLNLFSYTGSLAIAAAMGGAEKSVSIDLSKPATQWAQKNAELNRLNHGHQFVQGDVFDWTRRFKKKNKTFDIVISDPPSQSRSDELHFSTQKHLDFLHECCIDCLSPDGLLITSINTETISDKVLVASVKNTAERMGRSLQDFDYLTLPKGFDPNFRSMKGIRAIIK